MFNKYRQLGFSLLESVLATGIVLVGVVSIISLSVISLIGGQAASNQLEAVNFAREAMETVRNQRDSNWLAFDSDSTTAWNNEMYLTSGLTNDYSAVVTMDYPASSRMKFLPNALGDTCTGAGGVTYDCTAIWYDSANSRYIQSVDSSFVPAAYDQTQYQRLVNLYPICRDGTGAEQIYTGTGGCSSLGKWTQVGIDAIVTVQWSERGGTRTYKIEEHLYDWKY